MPSEFDFISVTDKPALLALSNPEFMDVTMIALNELGFKVHTAGTHPDFLSRFAQIPYQIVVTEELFAATTPEENVSLIALQTMPMAQRRHAAIILLGESLQTFNVLQAFQYSVHAVINRSELFLIGQLIQKVVEDKAVFLRTYLDIQARVAEGTA